MALTQCVECGARISSLALSCPTCGHRERKPEKRRWWLWLLMAPVAVVALWSASTPDYEKEARTARRDCESLVKKGFGGDMHACQQNFERAMKDGELKEWAEKHDRVTR